MKMRYALPALALLIGVAVSATFYVNTRNDIPATGDEVCIRDYGLPGDATGKLFHRIGRNEIGTDELAEYDAELYDVGDYEFLGYCGPDGEVT